MKGALADVKGARADVKGALADVKGFEMSLAPFLDAPMQIQVHAFAALTAVTIGPIALYRRQRDRIHKYVGYVWVLAMLTVAVSAFFIHSFAVIGPFSPLHGFAVVTFWSLWTGMRHIYAGRVRAHQATFRSLYWFGLMLAGLANFLPDRRANEVLFSGQDGLGWIAIATGAAGIAWVAFRDRKAAALATRPDTIAAE